MAVTITPDEISVFVPGLDPTKAQMLIDGAIATAYLSAPCLRDVEPDSDAAIAAKTILLSVVARWLTAGQNDGITQISTGPYSATFRAYSSKFSDAEQAQLRAICRSVTGGGKAFALDTMPRSAWTADSEWDSGEWY